MAIKTQGTELYFIDPEDGSVVEVGCVTSISGLDSSIEEIETTCLAATARTYESGLATPGNASFGINADPNDASHIRLHQLKTEGATLKWALGWSDGIGVAPTVDQDAELDLPGTRTWIVFDGFINSFPFEFAGNAVVASTVGIRVSGDPVWIPKE